MLALVHNRKHSPGIEVGGAARPLPRDEGVEEFHRDPTVGPEFLTWSGPEVQGLDRRSKMEEVVPKIARCRVSEARH